ncbi:sulfite exporter TauE/SafE family protein [Chengkuizengella axinellae]|uniref:Probable membrane transporter protein n=1 Tax=Chengkuizengella axinellae TaxID=3064388 RepID=A0ABT9IZE6_9BACL|nr:sulfite exporter TauE/SafE family protein [Chengkuizengella sp. 2205SS18-9]MDP5274155.1 sulfite exporter TauE/SafE family protein [Chengkuizengella sp. 2205SS18-9]
MDWIILITIVFLATSLQTSTGFGFSILGTPFLFLIYPAQEAIQINIVLSLFISMIMIYKVRHDINKTLVKRLIIGSTVGITPGLFIYLTFDVETFKIFIGILILILTVLLIFKLTIKRSRIKDFFTGGISGALTTSIGVPGPPLLLYFAGVNTDKSTLRSTTLAYYLFIYLISLIMQIIFAGTNKIVFTSSLIAIPSLLGGILFGQLLFKWINQEAFRIITYVILLITGSYMVISSFL